MWVTIRFCRVWPDLCGFYLGFCFSSPHSSQYFNKFREKKKEEGGVTSDSRLAALHETCVIYISLLGINNFFIVCWEMVFDSVGGLPRFVFMLVCFLFFVVEIRLSISLKIMNKQLYLHLQITMT